MLNAFKDTRQSNGTKNKEEKSKEGRHERYTYRAKREAAKDATLIWKGGIDVIMDRIQEFCREESFLYVRVREWEGLKNEDADNTFILILKFNQPIYNLTTSLTLTRKTKYIRC